MNRIFIFLLITALASLQPGASKSQAVKVADSLVLVDLYNSTNGPNWINHNNWLTGPVKSWIGITLGGTGEITAINLYQNNLKGNLPESIGNLKDLEQLILYNNILAGSIPNSIGNLTALTILDLNNADLVGKIPASIGNLINLKRLYLFSNKLTNGIPPELGKCTKLERLWLHYNPLGGSIPEELGNLTNLSDLSLAHNNLTGTVPASLGNLFSLVLFDLAGNNLTGQLPTSLGNLNNLDWFTIRDNQISGTIPASFVKMKNLRVLDVGNNLLSGGVPAELTNVTKLRYTYLENNHFTEDIYAAFFSPERQDMYLGIAGNYFTFNVLEKLKGLKNILVNDVPQDTILPLHNNGGILSVSAGGTLSKNNYNWYNGKVYVATILGDSTFPLQYSGKYTVRVGNSDDDYLQLISDTMIITGLPLPVRLTSFTGEMIHGAALLNWQTATEVNTAYFNVERSLDGLHFTTVGNVNAAGNSTVEKNYNFSDSYTGIEGFIYYRLTEVDKDGKHWRKNTIKLSTNAEAKVPVIWPNPVTNTLTLKWTGVPAQATYIIINIDGKQLLMQKQTASAQVKLNTQQLAAGTYILTIITAEGQKHSLKFVKQ